ncbi:nucleotide modification associated domain-containing protein [Aerococcus sp. HMSC062A02]|uniref:nucleotide modification associated domain-containing protein n=1 Tax=Aerococcus sp. HMSC062A02 TaxID=1715105 RepID=UPI0008A34B0E|nr:nucleotide modification associated domain-containing protein [Aerococcus sp. HMSC062A02]
MDHVLDEMIALYEEKNNDYGNSFDQSLDKHGLVASAVRLGDKLNRFENLIHTDQQVKDESIRDTLIDLANYAAMTVNWLDNQQSEPVAASPKPSKPYPYMFTSEYLKALRDDNL